MPGLRSKTGPVLVRLAVSAILPACLLILWLVFGGKSTVVPAAGEVFDVLVHPFRKPPDLDSAPLAAGTAVSLLRVAFGFAAAVVPAVPAGILIGRSRRAGDLLRPVVSVMMVVSPVAWMPLAIIAFGFMSVGTLVYGAESWRCDILDQLSLAVIVIIATGAFFPIAVNTSAGAAGVREAHVEAVKVLGGSRWDIFRTVTLPSSLPAIVTGLRIGGGVSWRVMVAAEFFPGTRSGLGHMILTAHSQGEYRYALAAILVIAAVGLAIDAGLAVAEHRAARWRRIER